MSKLIPFGEYRGRSSSSLLFIVFRERLISPVRPARKPYGRPKRAVSMLLASSGLDSDQAKLALYYAITTWKMPRYRSVVVDSL